MKFLVLSLLFVFSCAHQRTVEENIEGINQAEQEIEEGKYVYAPKIQEEEVLANNSESQYSVSLMGDGYEAFSFVSLLKELERRKIKVIGLSGQGSSALVAGLYAKYGKANMVEWLLFKYLDRFFPYEKSFEKEYRATVKKLIKREFKSLKDKSFRIRFKNASLLTNYQFILNEFEKELIKEKHVYAEEACVHESSLYQNYINLCFFASDKDGFRHDDIDRKSFGIKWYMVKDLPLIDVIERKNKMYEDSLREL